jgi:long-chain acyl-CoA synthetase
MLVNVLLEANRRFPKKLAVDDGVRSLTYRQLTLLAVVLRGVALRETRLDNVGVMLPASAAFPGTLFGILWASKVAVPLNFLLSAEELAAIVKDAGLDLILTARHFRDLASKLPARAVFLEDLPLKRKLIFSMLKPKPRVPQVDGDRTAVILYTSGTTAEPKGVELTYHNLHSNCVDSIYSLKIDPEQTFLNVLPPFHVFGLTALVLTPVALGATVYAIPRFSPLAVIKMVKRRGITVMMAIPSMYAAVLKAKSAKPDSFRSLFLAISGGEPLPESVFTAFKERFGVPLREGYGMTETSPVVSCNSPTAYRENTVGKPIRNVELRVVSTEGEELPCGGDGEILLRGPGVMKGYYNKPQETRSVLSPDGWFSTGDVGRLDADGFLTITGRAKDMLIIGGENVFPREIEAVLEEHDAVLQSAVIGIPDDLRGESPAAFVIPKQGTEVTEHELRNFAKQSLAGFKVPKRIIIREELPKGPTGKILKRRLRELL